MKIYQINIIEIHQNKEGGAGNPNFLLSNFDWKVEFSLYTKFADSRILYRPFQTVLYRRLTW